MGVWRGQETAAAPPRTVWKLSEDIKPPGTRPRRSLICGMHKTEEACNLFHCYKSAIVSFYPEICEHKHERTEINSNIIEIIEVIL